MSDTFRALCAELHTAIQLYTGLNPAAANVPPAELVCRLMDAMAASAALLAQPEPELVNTHYEWELQDADGNWQAGGSANSLNDVRREGTRYLQTYAQDGPHKLIISQHATQVIDEMTNV